MTAKYFCEFSYSKLLRIGLTLRFRITADPEGHRDVLSNRNVEGVFRSLCEQGWLVVASGAGHDADRAARVGHSEVVDGSAGVHACFCGRGVHDFQGVNATLLERLDFRRRRHLLLLVQPYDLRPRLTWVPIIFINWINSCVI